MYVNRAVRTQWGKVSEDRSILIVNRDRETGRTRRVKAARWHCPLGNAERGCN